MCQTADRQHSCNVTMLLLHIAMCMDMHRSALVLYIYIRVRGCPERGMQFTICGIGLGPDGDVGLVVVVVLLFAAASPP